MPVVEERSALPAAASDTFVAMGVAFFSMFGGAWILSQLQMSVQGKTAIAVLAGGGAGIALHRYSQPAALGLASGLGGLGLSAMIAQASGAANAGRLFGFEEMQKTRMLQHVRNDRERIQREAQAAAEFGRFVGGW